MDAVGRGLRQRGVVVEGERWQGVKPPAPMLEVLETGFRAPIPSDIEALAQDVKPNLPWADLHFAERVSGIPWNPPPSAEVWPFNPSSFEFREEEVYSHTYPERLWPQRKMGIRYLYGDLNDAVELLTTDPLTRQAFIPIWFPEDTGAIHGGRVPCTLGYWVVMRQNYIHITYYIRSCDYFRHFSDDIYMCGRLLLWILDKLRIHPTQKVDWSKVNPGFMNFYAGSMHCWASEKNLLP